MNTLMNSKIAKKLGISKTTVANYIQDALEHRNSLKMHSFDDKVQLIDSPHNWFELKRLVEEGRKYRPNDFVEKIEVSQEFYQLFDEQSQFEIIKDLEIGKEIDLKYYYSQQGAKLWNEKYQKKLSLISVEIEKMLTNSLQDVESSFESQQYNLIDIGCGNGSPADILIESNKIYKYIALDISQEMLNICKNNLTKRFRELDIITKEIDIQKVSGEFYFQEWNNGKPNLFLMAGNTIANFSPNDRQAILHNFTRVLDKKDLFLISYTLDSDSNKSNFGYVKDRDMNWLPELLGLNTEKGEIEVKYEETSRCKIKYIKLNKDYQLNFRIGNQPRTVNLLSGEQITIWRHYILPLEKIFEEIYKSGFKLVFAKATNENILIGCRLAIK